MKDQQHSFFGFFDSLPFTSGAAVWFALFAVTMNPESQLTLTIMFVNIALSAGYTARTMTLFLRTLKPEPAIEAKTVEEIAR
jgi:hypothetical protein